MTLINESAPVFELKSQNDTTVKLTDFEGKRVVLFLSKR